jgi:hypothetical protein
VTRRDDREWLACEASAQVRIPSVDPKPSVTGACLSMRSIVRMCVACIECLRRTRSERATSERRERATTKRRQPCCTETGSETAFCWQNAGDDCGIRQNAGIPLWHCVGSLLAVCWQSAGSLPAVCRTNAGECRTNARRVPAECRHSCYILPCWLGLSPLRPKPGAAEGDGRRRTGDGRTDG